MDANNNHLLVTEPDRVNDQGFRILLVDFEPQMIEMLISTLQGCSTDLIIYVYSDSDANPQWLLDTARESDIILVDANRTTQNDIFKGCILPLKTAWFVGRSDLTKFWPRHTNDALGTVLASIQKYTTQEE